jgi:hypothetical protein
MATSKFIREPKMFTTEPSVDEVGEGMKRGGHAKKHAKGGMIESAAHERKEERELKGIKKELKHHEHEKASKAHHGLKAGGRAPKVGPNTVGGLEGGLEATRRDSKHMTEGIEGPGYKKGGHAKHHAHGGKVHHVSGHPEGSHEHHKHMAKHHAAKHKEGGSAHHKKMHEHHKAHAKHMKDGGEAIDRFETKTTLKPKIDVKDKVHQAKQTKSFHTKTEGVEGAGYKRGGHLKKFAKGGLATAREYISKINDGSKMPTKKSGTGEIKEGPAGYKHGGHVAHHSKSKHEHAGHKSMHEHASKHHAHGGHVSHKEHMAHGGKAHKATGGKAKKCNW